jgi:putative addiction module component (TIGR02574 family)
LNQLVLAMLDPIAELSAQAKALPPEDRARLAEELLASLDPHDSDVEAAWDVELRRRVEEFEHGTVELVPAEQVFATVRRAMGK